MAIEAGVPIVPVCVSTYVRSMNLNRRDSGEVIIRTLPAVPTANLTSEDIPQLIARCHGQMQACIASMDAQLRGSTAAIQTDAEQH